MRIQTCNSEYIRAVYDVEIHDYFFLCIINNPVQEKNHYLFLAQFDTKYILLFIRLFQASTPILRGLKEPCRF